MDNIKDIRDCYGDDSILYVSRDNYCETIDHLKHMNIEQLQTYCEQNNISVFVKVASFKKFKSNHKYKSFEKCVHTEHCTELHCKYGDEDCPVFLGLKPASYPNQKDCY